MVRRSLPPSRINDVTPAPRSSRSSSSGKGTTVPGGRGGSRSAAASRDGGATGRSRSSAAEKVPTTGPPNSAIKLPKVEVPCSGRPSPAAEVLKRRGPSPADSNVSAEDAGAAGSRRGSCPSAGLSFQVRSCWGERGVEPVKDIHNCFVNSEQEGDGDNKDNPVGTRVEASSLLSTEIGFCRTTSGDRQRFCRTVGSDRPVWEERASSP